MKSRMILKTARLIIASFLLANTLISCDEGRMNGEKSDIDNKTEMTADDTTTFQGNEVANQYNLPLDDTLKISNSSFLTDVCLTNLEEILLGKLAQQISKSDDVESLGKMMENEHARMQKEIKTMAAKKTIVIPNAPSPTAMDHYDLLKIKTGAEFDKAYTELMITGHQKTVEKFQRAANEIADQEIKSWAASHLPAITQHLEHANMCMAKIK